MERTSVVLVVVLVVLGNTPQMFKLLYWVFLGGEHGGRVACRHCRIAVTWSTSLVSNSFPSSTGIALLFFLLIFLATCPNLQYLTRICNPPGPHPQFRNLEHLSSVVKLGSMLLESKLVRSRGSSSEVASNPNAT